MNPNYSDFKFPTIKAHPWNKVLFLYYIKKMLKQIINQKVFKAKVDPLAIDLISKILIYNPAERLNPLQALLHPYFDDLRT